MFKFFKKPKVLVASLALAIGLVIGGGMLAQSVSALPTDCNTNSIIKCGFQSLGEFKSLFSANNTKQSPNKKDLKSLYNNFGLQSSDIDRFAKEGKMGYAYKNGDVVVDGQKVMTNAWSLGREKFPGQTDKISIGGHTYYKSANSASFNSSKIPVFVLFNSDGSVEFAVLNSCGNPTWGNKVVPKYSCDKLNKTAVEGKENTYKFTTNATAANNAKVTKVTYDFGDGSAKVTKTNPKDAVEHTYTKPGSYTATVTVTVSLPGGKTKTTPISTKCSTPVKVEEEKNPYQACKELRMVTRSKEEREYGFTVETEQRDGPKFVSADFDFGDGQNQADVKPANENTASVNHRYDKKLEGEVTIKATVHFTNGKESTSDECTVVLNFEKQPPKECPEKPGSGLPVGHPDCEEKPETETPAEIPSTGPAELLGGVLGLGGLTGASVYYRNSRRNLVDQILKR